jgi:hypothetical protein
MGRYLKMSTVAKRVTEADHSVTRTVDHEYTMTRAELAEKVKKAPAKSIFYVWIRGDAPVETDSTKTFSVGIYALLQITRSQAISLAGRMLGETLENRGARIPLTMAVPENSKSPYIYYIG